ncbi:Proline dehydrogenase [Allomeiothermus silvanus DSM 9946]|uniref:proline dehydrogenase n=1 Tax=Allomeiothermus silvanus (strain ATCC 700542 / DSM 9946 / NBRC 106475 / NCIMB 13440 / VI-R2) TaxID=526227 RepID=D7BE97_ALLS1|nr:proline dehydrogenase family protein [Allomeiothermus silvanus]ADH64955.1 Proline dehydrogenase [Allomeiothermus silvanus DSM 9946]
MDLNLSYRSFVLAIAQNPSVKNLVLTRGKGLSRRFVAGDTLEEALKVVEGLERERIHAILDLLGEMVTSEEMARGFQAEIVGLIRALGARPYPRYVSVKLTQLGLDLSEDLAFSLMQGILQEARQADCFVRIDMEDSPRVDATLRVYRRLREEGYTHTGIVLQSYLKRSEKDLEALLPLKPAVRIVKGAYKEPPEVAFQDKRLIDAQYLLLAKKALENGLPTAIATHDPHLIAEMQRWTAEKGISKEGFEFQLLYGVRRDEQRRLAAEGYTVRAYVPYGTDWYPYLSRRIAERPENLLFVARSLVQG